MCSVDYSVATLEILEEICIKEWPGARNQSSDLRRNLYGYFGVAYGKKSLGEIFFKEWPEARNNLSLR